MLGQTELLVSLILFASTNIGLVVRRVRQDVVCLALVVDRRHLVLRELREDGLLLRIFRRDDFEAGGNGQVLFVLGFIGAAYSNREERDHGEEFQCG